MGEIITFYSYKGGTGRTMAMANVAWILAAAGNRVLMVDWDLEAPGLHRYFYPFLQDKELVTSTGVMDIVLDFMVQAMTPPSSEQDREKTWYLPYADVLRHAVSINWNFGKGQLDLLPAGRQNASYAMRVNSFNWDNFYERLGGGTFLEALRASMLREYEYVLVDSRTGVSDTSGICTVQLPDKVVVCFTLNRQSIEGAASVAHSIVEARARAGRSETKVFPVPTRVEKAETLRLDAARAAARARFDGLLSHVAQDARQRYWDESEIAYQPFYAYEEVLASFGDTSPRVGSLLHTMQRLAARLVGEPELAWQAPPAEKRDQVLSQYGWPSQATTPKPATQPTLEPAVPQGSPHRVASRQAVRPVYSIFVSYAPPDRTGKLETFVHDLSDLVRLKSKDDARTFINDIPSGARWLDQIADAIAGCRAAVLLVSPTYIRAKMCGREFAALEQQDVPIFPVCWVPVVELPPALHDREFFGGERIFRSGLHALMRIQRYARVYQEFLQDLAEHIARTPSERRRAPVRWDEIPDAFTNNAEDLIGMHLVAACVAPVAGSGGWDWQPFGSEPLGLLTQRAALEERFTISATSLTPSFADEIRDRFRLVGLILVASSVTESHPDAELLRQIDARAIATLSVVIVESEPQPADSPPHYLKLLPNLSSSHQLVKATSEEELMIVIRRELVRMRSRAIRDLAVRASSPGAPPQPKITR